MTEFGWRGLLQTLKIQRRFRTLLQRRQAPGGVGSTGGGLRGAHKPPEDEMDKAAVCLFCLSDNIFKDERSIMLFARAVKLGKQCELIVMPKAKWGPARDRLADSTPNTNPTRARARARALSPTPTLTLTPNP